MSSSDYIGVVIGLLAGVLSVLYRQSLARMAVRWHERYTGRRWSLRYFEGGYFLGGLLIIAWAVLVLVGHLLSLKT